MCHTQRRLSASAAFIAMQDVVTVGAGMLHIFARFRANYDQSNWEEPAPEHKSGYFIMYTLMYKTFLSWFKASTCFSVSRPDLSCIKGFLCLCSCMLGIELTQGIRQREPRSAHHFCTPVLWGPYFGSEDTPSVLEHQLAAVAPSLPGSLQWRDPTPRNNYWQVQSAICHQALSLR